MILSEVRLFVTKHSRMDQVNLWKTAFKKYEVIWAA